MLKFRKLLLTYFFKPYSKSFTHIYAKISPIINILKFIHSFRIVLLLIAIWRFHGFIYTLTSFVLVVVLGYDILDFLNILGFVYSNFIILFSELKINIFNRLYNFFNIKSIENIIQVVEKQVETSKTSRINKGNSPTVLPEKIVEPIRSKYVVNPKPYFVDNFYSLTDIITSKYFYIPVIFILSCYGITYHQEIFTGLKVVTNSLLDWYNWYFNIKPGGGTSDLLNNTSSLVNGLDNSPNISTPNTPTMDSIRVSENWSNYSRPSSPTSTGSTTPTASTSSTTPTALTPLQEEFNRYFRDPD